MYLVDTNVISERAPARVAPAEMTAWMDAHSEKLFLSVVTIAEIEDGIAKAKREGAARKSRDLSAWLETVLHLYAARILPFDIATARLAGALSDFARSQGHAPGFADIVIAATAQRHGLIILTRNLRHFAPLGVPAHDPFAHPPQNMAPE
ncbi:MAG: type II toxin-antitoxin system VapC family toxin [Acidibrevibacterium sp.]|uniref:type II toxin-antitoxin system VapC family toxin n=1 Tax=Acidibrevibacterium fodinaquatile TaxID=1969806 RepID=UPI0023A7E3DF|nr:type II toxin-antitoxin system VapC family toxin [Acidibrevibacterium fodinaquatile]MCA7118400.1 type II toxin-antitoxin system VapC family toxin [Acidibrevibacterium fodinaquatile]